MPPRSPVPLIRPRNFLQRGEGARLNAFERECVLFFEEVVQIFGVPKSVGQIYGLIYASPIALSFSDIVTGLSISKGSTSQGLQLLRSLGAVTEAPVQGGDGRGALYQPELSLRRLIGGVLKERIAPVGESGGKRLVRILELAKESGPESQFYLERAKQLNTWGRRLTTVLPVISALLAPKNEK